MNLIEVQHLTKRYKSFTLQDVSFSLEQGFIMGFIGRNGAGKSTTIKSMLNLVHADEGSVALNGFSLERDELSVKKSVGFVTGGVDYYPQAKLKTLTSVTKSFYEDWDDERYHKLCERFELDESKRVRELSAGMKVKYAIALAMSHNARLLILDEPTSGLDPAARDDLLILFQEFIEDGEHSILFSTHITSDLEKCADYITYIHEGKILASTDRESFKQSYLLVSGAKAQLTGTLAEHIIGLHSHRLGFEGLIRAEDKELFGGVELSNPSLDDIMVHIERRN